MQSNTQRKKHRLVIVGAGSDVAKHCMAGLEPRVGLETTFVLVDKDASRFGDIRQSIGQHKTFVSRVDVENETELESLVSPENQLVLNLAAPHARTSEKLIAWCIKHGYHYLDTNTDADSIIACHEKYHVLAEQKQISVCLGCNTAPGVINTMVKDLVSQFAQVDQVRTFHSFQVNMASSRQKQNQGVSSSHLEQLLHHGSGQTVTRKGRTESIAESFYAEPVDCPVDIAHDLPYYEMGLPSAEMLKRSLPKIPEVRSYGSVFPLKSIATIRALSSAIDRGDIITADAINYLTAGANMKKMPAAFRESATAYLKAAKAKIKSEGYPSKGKFGSLFKRKTTPKIGTTRVRHLVLYVEATGYDNTAQPASMSMRIRQSDSIGIDLGIPNKADGTAIAAFSTLFLQNYQHGSIPAGVLFPEDWVSPPQLYQTWAAMLNVRAKPQDLVAPITRTALPSAN